MIHSHVVNCTSHNSQLSGTGPISVSFCASPRSPRVNRVVHRGAFEGLESLAQNYD